MSMRRESGRQSYNSTTTGKPEKKEYDEMGISNFLTISLIFIKEKP